MNGALPFPSYDVKALIPGTVTIFQSRDDYQGKIGLQPPPFDPLQPAKFWMETGQLMTDVFGLIPYLFPRTTPQGAVVVVSQPLYKKMALSVNIPSGAANAPGADNDVIPFPIRPLFDDEELALSFGGVVVVRNKKLWAELTAPAVASVNLDPVIFRLDQILAKLTKAGI